MCFKLRPLMETHTGFLASHQLSCSLQHAQIMSEVVNELSVQKLVAMASPGAPGVDMNMLKGLHNDNEKCVAEIFDVVAAQPASGPS